MLMSTDWTIFYASYYVTYPKKGKNNTLFSPPVAGREIPPEKIPDVLLKFFHRNFSAYPVGITFSSRDKSNPIRDMIVDLSKKGTNKTSISESLAERLSRYMDNKSNSGLLVTMCGELADRRRIVILKFPQEIILTPGKNDIVQIDEAYATEFGYVKAAIFEDIDSPTSFWTGKVEDKENSATYKQAASYWINEFLLASTDITDPVGTRILASIIKESIDNTPSLEEKNKLILAYESFKNRQEVKTTVNQFIDTFVPKPQQDVFYSKLKNESYLNTPFVLIPEDAQKIIGYESLELNNGIIIIGPENVIKEQVDLDDIDNHRILIRGDIQSKRLRSKVR
jgi:hypothetical protein